MKDLIIAILVLSVCSHAYAESNKGKFAQGTGDINVLKQELTVDEQENLIYMREEEKLARDIYLTFSEYFDLNIFRNIAVAEQKHMDGIKGLLDKYELEDPVIDNTVGVFENSVFSEFYDNKTNGYVTIKEAILTGILIEETDILDLQQAINLTDNIDIQNVYGNLLRGSRNHLRAFVSSLESMGIVYEAKLLEQAVADAIVNSPTERGASSQNANKGRGRRWN